jgi:ribonucleotide monophosphatase NagD (HAD superfamily)
MINVYLFHCRLKDAGIPIRFCTNETQSTKELIVAKLNRLGYNLEAHEIFPPAPAVRSILLERGLRPHLLVHDSKYLFQLFLIKLTLLFFSRGAARIC